MPSFRDRLRKLQLTQLSQIEVAAPCSAPWEELEGDEKVRFCSQCQLHVFNLSAMDVEEAGALIAEHADGLCVRFFRRADGTLLTTDCPVGVERKRRRRRLIVRRSVGATLGLSMAASIAGTVLMPLLGSKRDVTVSTPGRIDVSRRNPFSETIGELRGPVTSGLIMRIAISTANLHQLRSLLETEGDPDATDSDGGTLLMTAAELGRVDAVSLLLKHGATLNARDHLGRSALSIAVAEKHDKVATLLRSAGAVE